MGNDAIDNDSCDAHNVVRGLQVNQLGTPWQIAICLQRAISKRIREGGALGASQADAVPGGISRYAAHLFYESH